MTPKPMPPPQEVKTYDTPIVGTTAGAGFVEILTQVSPPLAAQSPISGIVVGAGSNQRVGRQIRVVGIVLRGVIASLSAVATEGLPYTMDIIWDSQSNGALPTLASIYDFRGTAGGNIDNLPNPNFAKRFTFAKRIETTGRAGIPTAKTIVNCSIKTNRLVNFDNSAGVTQDVEKNNLLLTFASTATLAVPATFTGVIRFLYVDA